MAIIDCGDLTSNSLIAKLYTWNKTIYILNAWQLASEMTNTQTFNLKLHKYVLLHITYSYTLYISLIKENNHTY